MLLWQQRRLSGCCLYALHFFKLSLTVPRSVLCRYVVFARKQA